MCIRLSIGTVFVVIASSGGLGGGGGNRPPPPPPPHPHPFAAGGKSKRKERKKEAFSFSLFSFNCSLKISLFSRLSASSRRFTLVKSTIHGSNAARRRKCAVKITKNVIGMHWFYIRIHCMHGNRCKPLPVLQRSSDAIHTNGLPCRIKSPRKKRVKSERKVDEYLTILWSPKYMKTY